jgi:plastocyanin
MDGIPMILPLHRPAHSLAARPDNRRGRIARRVAVLVGALVTLGTGVTVDAGNVIGTVRYVGKPLPPEILSPAGDHAVCGRGPRPSEALLLSPSGAVQNAVVTLVHQRVEGWRPPPILDLDQRRCAFVPRILIVPVESTVTIRNSDGILHNFHTLSRLNPPVNLAQPGFAKPLRVTFRYPETVSVKCDVHGRGVMRAWIVVAAHPYYALTDEDGRFQISNAPPGSHVLEVWHEVLGTKRIPISVGSSGEVSVAVSFGQSSAQ